MLRIWETEVATDFSFGWQGDEASILFDVRTRLSLQAASQQEWWPGINLTIQFVRIVSAAANQLSWYWAWSQFICGYQSCLADYLWNCWRAGWQRSVQQAFRPEAQQYDQSRAWKQLSRFFPKSETCILLPLNKLLLVLLFGVRCLATRRQLRLNWPYRCRQIRIYPFQLKSNREHKGKRLDREVNESTRNESSWKETSLLATSEEGKERQCLLAKSLSRTRCGQKKQLQRT